MSQTDLAKALGEYQSFVVRMENGQRRIDIIEYENLARILKFDVHEFFTPEDLLDRLSLRLRFN